MENICSFEPLWKDLEADVPREDITRIRLKALEVFLHDSKYLRIRQPPSLDLDIVAASLRIIKHLVSFWKGDNPIIARIRTIAVKKRCEPIIAVRGAMALWYTSCLAIFLRDIHQGVPSEEEITTFRDGTIIATWNREYATECHYAGNLGLMAMLLTTEAWLPPKDPKLQLASLVSSATTTILFAAYMISSRIPTFDFWNAALSTCPNNQGAKLFLRSAWRLAQRKVDSGGARPGSDFGAHIDEFRVSRNGKSLLSKVGRADWAIVPFWHPCKRVPGSHWNKWIRNSRRPVFPTSPVGNVQTFRIDFRLPSSATLLTAVFVEHYSTLRTRFDQKNRSRTQLTPEESKDQFARLARETGHAYSCFIPGPDVKKPICDSTGNLTFPFLTTAIRALRFQEDPDEIEQNLLMMVFSLTIPLPL
uniref:Mat1-1-2 n=1 Tax=Trichoderma spinulosum TaxID=1491020 RepID=A0A223FZ59_TRISN|nr:mat1-1-2 [Trichoderma spinulosum]AST15025.1 mat1-1-2 [Trichoderma spinulosum]